MKLTSKLAFCMLACTARVVSGAVPSIDMNKICKVLFDLKVTPEIAAAALGPVGRRHGDTLEIVTDDPVVARARVTLKPKDGVRVRDLDVDLEYVKGTALPAGFRSFCPTDWLVIEPNPVYPDRWRYDCIRQTSNFDVTVVVTAELTAKADDPSSRILTLSFERSSSQYD